MKYRDFLSAAGMFLIAGIIPAFLITRLRAEMGDRFSGLKGVAIG